MFDSSTAIRLGLDARRVRTTLAGLGLVAAAAMPATAFAEPVSSGSASVIEAQAEMQQGADFEDETLEAFADAQTAVEEVRMTYTQRFQAAETEEQRAAISQEANQEMVEAVDEQSDISVEEYNAIVEAAAADPELAERINEMIQERAL